MVWQRQPNVASRQVQLGWLEKVLVAEVFELQWYA